MKYRIGVYKVNRSFGGSEEGGWWYTYGLLEHRSSRAFSERLQADEYASRFQKRLDRYYNNRGSKSDLNSVLCDGVMVAEVHQGELPPYYPDRKPHYQ